MQVKFSAKVTTPYMVPERSIDSPMLPIAIKGRRSIFITQNGIFIIQNRIFITPNDLILQFVFYIYAVCVSVYNNII